MSSAAAAAGRAPRGSLPAWTPWAVLGAAAVLVGVLWAATDISIAVLVVAGVLASALIVYVTSRAVEGSRKATDRTVTIAVASAFFLAIVPLASLIYTVFDRGLARFDVAFFTESLRGHVGEGGGAAHAILGTLIITGIATIVSVPIGIMAAVYLQEFERNRLGSALTFFVDVMTGIPSIVAGLFAYALFALVLGPGIRLGVIGSVALSILMIPIVVRSTEEMLRVVPNSLREASFALGVSKWRTTTQVVLPAALGGIVTGVMLAVARIVGETAPLLVTTGLVTSINTDPFDGRMNNLAVFAYNEYKNPGVPPEPYYQRAWAAALTLIVLVMSLNLIARLVYRRFAIKAR